MGWLDDQIKERRNQDDLQFTKAYEALAQVVMKHKHLHRVMENRPHDVVDLLEELLAYYELTPGEISSRDMQIQDILEDMLRPTHMMKRKVKLKDQWYHDGVGCLLVMDQKEQLHMLYPGSLGGYHMKDQKINKMQRVNQKQAKQLHEEAYCFYPPLPQTPLTKYDLFQYVKKQLQGLDLIWLIIMLFAMTLLGCMTPYITEYIFTTVLQLNQLSLLYGAIAIMISFSLSSFMMNIITSTISTKIETTSGLMVEAAVMMRTLHLPVTFFQTYGAGELAGRIENIPTMFHHLTATMLVSGLSAVCSCLYLIQVFVYTPSLVKSALLFIIIQVLLWLMTTIKQVKQVKKQTIAENHETNTVYTLLTGIQKIKNAGAEKRAFASWASAYEVHAKTRYQLPKLIPLYPILSMTLSLFGTIVFYMSSISSNVDAASFMVFQSAYGMINGAILSLTSISSSIALVFAIQSLLEPILTTEPETTSHKQVVKRLSGSIECNNLTFRYEEHMPPILDNISLKIKAHQYVAIVGETGCGKSTIMKLCLGFLQPQKGAIYYDGKDLQTLDITSVRRKIGVVLQDGKLFQGDIFSNITISDHSLTLEDAWKAAELAGIKEEIEEMPMGMFTLLSEGNGGISGGQRQRLLIARAIAAKPKILMFDEATSALDNVTQKQVSDALQSLRCTRIVIAHRLSTIKQCDRILVLHHGKFVEDGDYEALMRQNGLFKELVLRQQIKEEQEVVLDGAI